MTYPLFDSAADTNIEQGKLFSAKDLAGTYYVHQPQHHTTIDQDAIALNQWKQRVLAYQQTHQHQASPSQHIFKRLLEPAARQQRQRH